MNHEWRLLVLSLFLVAVRSEKIGILLSTLSNSQILFGTQLAEVLRSDQHEVVLIRPQLNPEANWKSGELREIRIDALGGQPAVFHDFYAMEQEIIFGEPPFYDPLFVRFGAAFRQLMNVSCIAMISNSDFLNQLKQENFDLIYVNHHLNCGLAVARHLGVRYVRFSSASMGRTLAHPSGIPAMPSITPAWLSPFTDRMTYWERAINLLISLAETSEDYSIRKLDVLYRQYFGPDFPSGQQLAEDALLCFVNDEELFNYPRLTSHKIVYIGGLGQEEDGETSVKFDQEYSKFIGDYPTVLVSLGSVANSTQMPQEWKDEFVKTFGLLKDVRFVWKYDGLDVQTTANVLVRKWIPQNALLKSGKVAVFFTHAGYNSLSESLYAAVPTVLLPLFADQARNANLAKVRGVGVVVKKGEMRAEVLAERIGEVLSNSSYSTAAQKVQRLLRNKPFKASEQIVRWNRFLLTNTVDLNVVSLGFFAFYSLDVLLPLVFLPALLLLWIFYRLLRLYWWSCFGMQKRSSHLKRE